MERQRKTEPRFGWIINIDWTTEALPKKVVMTLRIIEICEQTSLTTGKSTKSSKSD